MEKKIVTFLFEKKIKRLLFISDTYLFLFGNFFRFIIVFIAQFCCFFIL